MIGKYGSRSIWNRNINIWFKLYRHRHKNVVILLLICLLMVYFLNQRTPKELFSNCTQIDVVYTWVNGSDSAFIESIRKFHPNYNNPARFDDKNELRFSLRSLEKYAPWIRQVFLVTNGQIPNWLDLSQVTIVPHEVLSPNQEWLPTFSSAAIETFIHRIPTLSERFLYLNDDIFLGAPLYPEDLYTESEGVKIYQSWIVPDCIEDCPWQYIGDGQCDIHCNIPACQYDGGDCDSKMSNEIDKDIETKLVQNIKKPFEEIMKKINPPLIEEDIGAKNKTKFDLRYIVDQYNTQTQNMKHSEHLTDHAKKNNIFEEVKTTKDVYSQSLVNTNMLLNFYYGFKTRSVPAHIGFLIEKQIVKDMQDKFQLEIAYTASQRFRTPKDLQFAFAYYSFIINENRNVTQSDIFDEFDTDSSGTWSDREIRTVLTRMYDPPLDFNILHYFEEVVNNCSKRMKIDKSEGNDIHTTLFYERYRDSNLPTVTKKLVTQCPILADALQTNFGKRNKYKFTLISKRKNFNNFMMLTSNVSNVVDELDKIRRSPKKFNCINDNMDMRSSEDNILIRQLLEDFYLSFFPKQSKYELPNQYRNRFSNWKDYQKWQRRSNAVKSFGYTFSAIILFLSCRFICTYKAKLVRPYIQRL